MIPVFSLACLALAGCRSTAAFRSAGVRPAESEVTISSAPVPVSATIGLLPTEYSAPSGVDDMMAAIRRDLETSRTFGEVVYPLGLGEKPDGVLKISVRAEKKPNRVGLAASPVTIFLVPVAIAVIVIRQYDEKCTVTCDATLEKDGRVLKTYRCVGVSRVVHGDGPDGEYDREAARVACRLMTADLVEKLSEDFPVIRSQLLRKTTASGATSRHPKIRP